MTLYYVTLYVQIFKAVNRFCAIFYPLAYRRLFSNENVKFILLGVIAFSLPHGILYFFPGCNFYYDGYAFIWDYDATSCYNISTYVDFFAGCSIMGITMLIDTCTLCLIIKSKLFSNKNSKEVKFFIQNF